MLGIVKTIAQVLKLVNFITGWLRDRGLVKQGRAEAIRDMKDKADEKVKRVQAAKRPDATLDDDLNDL